MRRHLDPVQKVTDSGCGGKCQGISALSRESRTKEGMRLDQGAFEDYEMSVCPHITDEKHHSLQPQATRK